MNVFELFAKLSLDSSEYDAGLDKARSAGSALGSGLASAARIGLRAVEAATTAVTAMGAASVHTGAEFDKSMSQVAATMGVTVDQIDNLRDFAQEMGRTTAFSATQAADALNYMALAGYDAATSMEMLPNVLNLAAAGDMDLALASDMLTDTQTAFGISLERTNLLVDEMAQAASTGNTSVTQLGEAFLTVGGLAQELNGGMVTLDNGTEVAVDGIQELEIALTAMANAGIKGSEAGTHMRNMLLKLSSPTSDGVAQLEALGVAVFDTEGNMRSLQDVFSDLNGALGDLTQEQKIQAISDLFNTRDLASAEALLNAVSEDWDEIGESILNAEGAASQMAETQLDNLSGDMTLFKSALEGAQIAISDVLTPSLREFVQFGTSGLSDLTAAFQEGGITGAMEVFGDVLSDGLNMIISKLPEFVDAGIKLLGALGQGLLDNLPTIIDAAIKIIIKLNEGLIQALPVLTKGAIQLVIGLANGISSALPELYPVMYECVIEMGKALIDNLPALIDAAINLIEGIVEGIVNALPILIEGVIQLVLGIIKALPSIITKIIAELPKIVSLIAKALIYSLPALIEGCITLVVELVKNLPTIIAGLIEAIPEIIIAILEAFFPFGEGLLQIFADAWVGIEEWWQGVVAWFQELGQQIVDFFQPAVDAITNVIDTIIDIWNSFMQTISPLIEAVKYLFETIFKAIQIISERIWTAISNKITEVWNAIINFIIPILTKIHDFIGEIMEKVKTVIETIWNAIKEKIDTVLNFIKSIVETAFNALYSLIEEPLNRTKDMIGNVFDSIKNIISGIIDGAKNWGHDLIDNFVGGIKDKISTVTDAVTNVADTIRNIIGFSEPEIGPLSNFHTFAPDMIDLFTSGLEAGKAQIQSTMSDVLALPEMNARVNTIDDLNTVSAGGMNDMMALLTEALGGIVVQVNLGTERFDDMVSTSIQRTAYRSGGRG